EEERTRVAPDGAIEAERVRVELRPIGEIADMEVDVPHRRPRGHALPLRTARRGHHGVDVDRIGGHDQFAAEAPPARARPVGVDLDAEPDRVGEVEGLADEMVAGAGGNTELREVPDEATECGAVGEEQSEVEEPEPAATEDRTRPRSRAQLDQRAAAGAELRLAPFA